MKTSAVRRTACRTTAALWLIASCFGCGTADVDGAGATDTAANGAGVDVSLDIGDTGGWADSDITTTTGDGSAAQDALVGADTLVGGDALPNDDTLLNEDTPSSDGAADTGDVTGDDAVVDGLAADVADGQGDGAAGASDVDAADVDAADVDAADVDAADVDAADVDAADVDAADVDAGLADGDAGAGDAVADATTGDGVATSDGVVGVDAPPGSLAVDPKTLPTAAFTDVTNLYGVDSSGMHHACVAVADFDLDGNQDFVVVKRFAKTSSIHTVMVTKTGLKHGYTNFDLTTMSPDFGCSATDITGDGYPDLLFGGHSGAALYAGNGKGEFTDISAKWLPYIMDFAAFTVVPVDLDGDGDLDIYVGAGFDPPSCTALKCQFTSSDLLCILDPPIVKTKGMQDRVIIQGPTKPMNDMTSAWKVPSGGNQTVAMAFDVDEDGHMDMLVGDDMGSHRILRNTAGNGFVAYEGEVGFHPYAGAMGWAVGDFNNDGLFDLVLAESGPLPLYLQAPAKPGQLLNFIDSGGVWKTWYPTWGASEWAPLVADFDHDGNDDLLSGISVNFSPEKAANFTNVCTASRANPDLSPFDGEPSIDVLFLNDGGKTFTPMQLPAGKYPHVVLLDQQLIDLDGDGDLDIVQTRPGATAMPSSLVRILRNDLAKKGGSFSVVVSGKGGNKDALGAVVSADIGGIARKRWLNGSGGFGGARTRFAHFGLGSAAKATNVTVRWPDGSKTLVGDAVAGEIKTVVWK